MRKIGIKVNCYKGCSYSQTLDGIANAGFKYVELSTSNGNPLNLSKDSTKIDLEILKNELKNRDLIPIAIGGNSDLSSDDVSNILANITLANYLGCEYVDTIIRNEVDDTKIISNIKEYLPYLEKYNLDLVIELCGPYSKAEKLKNILNTINSKYVHINYDTANAIYYTKMSTDELINDFNTNKENITFIHLKDIDENYNYKLIGEGIIPIDKFINNDKTIIIEIESVLHSLDEVNKAVKDSYEYINNLIGE